MALKKKGTVQTKAPKKVGKKATPKTVEKPEENFLSEEDVENLAAEYDALSEQISALNKKKTEISDKLKEIAGKRGQQDNKGSFYYPVGTHMIGKVHSQSYKLNHEKGYAFCKEKGLTDCVNQVTTYQVDEQAVAQAVQEERVTLEEVREGMYDYSDSYRISVKPLDKDEEMPEVQQSQLKKK